MSFHRYGETIKIPRSDHVEIHVRKVVLNPDLPEERQVKMVEIREYIVSGGIYGHGVIIPEREVADLRVALDRLVPRVSVTSA